MHRVIDPVLALVRDHVPRVMLEFLRLQGGLGPGRSRAATQGRVAGRQRQGAVAHFTAYQAPNSSAQTSSTPKTGSTVPCQKSNVHDGSWGSLRSMSLRPDDVGAVDEADSSSSFQTGSPRVINTDKNPAFGEAVAEPKKDGAIPEELQPRRVKYLNTGSRETMASSNA